MIVLRAAVLIGLCCAWGAGASAAEQPNNFYGMFGVGAIRTDNIGLGEINRQGETIGVLSADIDLHSVSRHWVLDVISNLQYFLYQHHVYSDELVGNFAGLARFSIVPERFDWVAQDNFGQQQIVPGEPVTPNNRENVNYFSTGPDLKWVFGSRVATQLSGRVSRVSFRTSDLNSNRQSGAFILRYSVDDLSSLSANVTTERVRYDDSNVNQDFVRNQAFARYQSKTVRLDITADAGSNEVTGLPVVFKEALWRLKVGHAFTRHTYLELSAGREITDSGGFLREVQNEGITTLNFGSIQRSSDPFSSRYGRLSWGFERNRTGLRLSAGKYKEDHVLQQNLSHTHSQGDIGLRRDLTPTLALEVGGAYTKEDYQDTVANSNSKQYYGALAWRAGSKLTGRLQVSHIRRNAVRADLGYTDNRVLLMVGWAVGEPMRIARPRSIDQ